MNVSTQPTSLKNIPNNITIPITPCGRCTVGGCFASVRLTASRSAEVKAGEVENPCRDLVGFHSAVHIVHSRHLVRLLRNWRETRWSLGGGEGLFASPAGSSTFFDSVGSKAHTIGRLLYQLARRGFILERQFRQRLR